jgi:hypothetical protein
MASQSDICNMALGFIGVSLTIGNINEQSNGSVTCLQFWNIVQDYMLRQYNWKFAAYRVTAQPLADPPQNWGYVYPLPADCLKVKCITIPGLRNPRADQRAPFEQAAIAGIGRVIYTDMNPCELQYTSQITDTEQWDPMFCIAFAYLLGSFIAMPLSSTPSVAAQCRAASEQTCQLAIAQDLVESQPDAPPDCAFISERDGYGPQSYIPVPGNNIAPAAFFVG